MEDTINERIRLLYKNENLTLKMFGTKLGVAQGTLNNMFSRHTSPSFDIIYKIAKTFPHYSLVWLITGCGNMLVDTTPVNKENPLLMAGDEQAIYEKTDYREKYILSLEDKIVLLENKIKLLEEKIKLMENL